MEISPGTKFSLLCALSYGLSLKVKVRKLFRWSLFSAGLLMNWFVEGHVAAEFFRRCWHHKWNSIRLHYVRVAAEVQGTGMSTPGQIKPAVSSWLKTAAGGPRCFLSCYYNDGESEPLQWSVKLEFGNFQALTWLPWLGWVRLGCKREREQFHHSFSTMMPCVAASRTPLWRWWRLRRLLSWHLLYVLLSLPLWPSLSPYPWREGLDNRQL